ncbi:hypothetical protein [Methylobacterium platani]|uniref:Uncharacterized protein n=2 Tax=Methylobacterium platani TaxID=427683 RepID=A0A179SHE0_9HYPH|nr:hypothetical protein [Methylobacterium platani]KMO11514.1 hypothetical protein SQ03_27020 [Methylobacterium platani JCM 14648]OAS26301.1 hypothetical protein A5481_06190 [Methylobacterium platani]
MTYPTNVSAGALSRADLEALKPGDRVYHRHHSLGRRLVIWEAGEPAPWYCDTGETEGRKRSLMCFAYHVDDQGCAKYTGQTSFTVFSD